MNFYKSLLFVLFLFGLTSQNSFASDETLTQKFCTWISENKLNTKPSDSMSKVDTYFFRNKYKEFSEYSTSVDIITKSIKVVGDCLAEKPHLMLIMEYSSIHDNGGPEEEIKIEIFNNEMKIYARRIFSYVSVYQQYSQLEANNIIVQNSSDERFIMLADATGSTNIRRVGDSNSLGVSHEVNFQITFDFLVEPIRFLSIKISDDKAPNSGIFEHFRRVVER